MSKDDSVFDFSVSRRAFLATVAAASATIPSLAADPEAPSRFRFRVRRPRDLMNLDFEFINFEVHRGYLCTSGDQGLVVVTHGPQNLAEATFTDPDPDQISDWKKLDSTPENAPPVRAYLAGPSRLVFRAPMGAKLPLDLSCRTSEAGPGPCCGAVVEPGTGICPECGRMPAAVVDYWLRTLTEWNLKVPAAANALGKPGAPTPIIEPGATETSLEVPFRLMISPYTEDIEVATSADPLPYDSLSEAMTRGRATLWHASLRSRQKLSPPTADPKDFDLPVELKPPTRLTLRAKAVWTPDINVRHIATYYPENQPLSLRAMTRRRLVEQMSAEESWIDAERLILTSLGATANLAYTSTAAWDEILAKQLAAESAPPKLQPDEPAGNACDNNLAFWRHRMTMGRDQYFVEAYYVFGIPLLLPAIFVSVTQRHFAARKPNGGSAGPQGAFLLERCFILLTDPKRQFPPGTNPLGRSMPFKKIEIRETRSPYLQNPTRHPMGQVNGNGGKIVDRSDPAYEEPANAVIDRNGVDVDTGFYFFPKTLDGKYFRWSSVVEDDKHQQALSEDVTLLFASNALNGQRLWEKVQPGLKEWKTNGTAVTFAPDQPTLDVSSAIATTKSFLDRPASAPVPDPFAFLDSERQVVKAIGDALRKKFDGFGTTAERVNYLKAVTRDKLQQILADAQQSVAPLARLREEAITAIARAALAIDTSTDAMLNDVLRQLCNADIASTALELKSLKLDFFRVDKLYSDINTIRAAIDSIAAADVPAYITAAKSKLSSLDSSFRAKIEAQLDGLAGFGNFDTSSPANSVRETAKAARAYFQQIADFRETAKTLGVDKFQATLDEAQAVVPAMKALVGQSATQAVKLIDSYTALGINSVGSSAFGEVVGMLNEGAAMADRIKTGLASPQAMVAGLSRDLGALVADSKAQLLQMAGLPAAPPDLVNAVPDAKLFGVIPLRELLGVLAAGEMPTINLLQTPESITHVWEWIMPLRPSYSLGVLTLHIDPKKAPKPVRLWVRLKTTIELGKPQALVDGLKPVAKIELDGFLGQWDESKRVTVRDRSETFHVVLQELINAQFYSLEFSARYTSGESVKPKIEPQFKDIEFLGPLRFVRDFQERLKNLSGFEIVLSPVQIGVGLSISIPPFAFGVVAIRNIRLVTKFLMPLQTNPLRYEFGFCSWEQPFELSVMGFAGGGFFAAAFQTDGYRDIRGALEFGGSLAFEVAVASGGVHVRAGIYGRMANGTTEIMGYVRAWGELSVLGLINASVTFLLGLVYRNANGSNELFGVCEVTVSIDILFVFSGDVTIRMEKRFIGSDDSGAAYRLISHLSERTAAMQVAAPAIPRRSYFSRRGIVNGRFDWNPKDEGASLKHWNTTYYAQFGDD